MNIRYYWDKYFWIVALIVLGMFLLVSLYGREPFCAPNEHCMREWVSALSGWVAAAGAFLTIGAMLNIQRQNVELQLHRSATLARRVTRRCNNIRINLGRIQEAMSNENLATIDEVAGKALRRVKENFDDADFDEFEKVAFVGATYLRSTRRALANALTGTGFDAPYRRSWRKTALDVSRREKIENAVARADEHQQRLTAAAERFIEKWKLADV